MLPRSLASTSALLLALAPAACGGPAAAPQAPAAAAATPEQSAATGGDSAPAQQQPAPGGYTAQDPASPEVQAAAAKAVELLRTRASDPSLALGRVVSASTQVVAGQNYQMKLELTSAGGPRVVTVVLYRDLQGGEQLTSAEGL